MKDKERKIDETKITGFFDDGTEFNGELKFKGSFRVDGFFRGRIDSESHLIIGERGKVEADVHVSFALINGEFRGTIVATERIEIHSRGRVFGTIQAPKLVIEEGAYLEANCQTLESKSTEDEVKSIIEQ
ncbi:MAG: polymer-forming cytoskeletal protein [Candidatus Aminicenantes bacterium]|nr:polymer-forming cytoskeletal protein [Candidatus Aminicenantes bacterium]